MKRALYTAPEQAQAALFDEAEANEGVGDEHDYYPTPSWCTRAILPHLPACGSVLDPCAGTGAILREFDPERVARHALEIDRGRLDRLVAEQLADGWDCCDALGPDPWPATDLIIQNPSFALGLQFVERALAEARERRATVAVLLRLTFAEGKERAAFHKANPCDLHVFANRPAFADPKAWRTCPRCKGGKFELKALSFASSDLNGDKCERCNGRGQIKGGTDSTTAAWFVWGPGRGGRWQVLDDVDPNRRGRR